MLDPGAVGQNRSILVWNELLSLSSKFLMSLIFSLAYVPGPGFSFCLYALSLSRIELKGATLFKS